MTASLVLGLNTIMQTISIDSSQDDLNNANFKIEMQYLWANRQTQTQDVIKYISYLDACNQVIIAYSHHTQPDLNQMNTDYNALF